MTDLRGKIAAALTKEDQLRVCKLSDADIRYMTEAVLRQGLSVTRRGYVGWVEFASCTATTHIAYLYEDGSIYLPEGLDVVSEVDLRNADATNRIWPLIRSEWTADD